MAESDEEVEEDVEQSVVVRDVNWRPISLPLSECVFVAEGMLNIQHSINNCPFVFQIYWAGPILGGICAVLLYTQAFKASAPRYNVSERYRTAADDKEMARLDSKRDLA